MPLTVLSRSMGHSDEAYQQRAATLSGEQAEAIARAMLAQGYEENVRKSA